MIVSIVGPDGVEECPPYFGLSINDGHCAPQRDVDRPKREAEILAKLQAEGRKPVWQSAEGAALAEKVRAKAGSAAVPAEASGPPGATAAVKPASTTPDSPTVAPSQSTDLPGTEPATSGS